jgi:hypothetical protein
MYTKWRSGAALMALALAAEAGAQLPRRLAVVEPFDFAQESLGERDLRVGVDEGLLIDPSHAFHVADIERVPRLRGGRLWAPQ